MRESQQCRLAPQAQTPRLCRLAPSVTDSSTLDHSLHMRCHDRPRAYPVLKLIWPPQVGYAHGTASSHRNSNLQSLVHSKKLKIEHRNWEGISKASCLRNLGTRDSEYLRSLQYVNEPTRTDVLQTTYYRPLGNAVPPSHLAVGSRIQSSGTLQKLSQLFTAATAYTIAQTAGLIANPQDLPSNPQHLGASPSMAPVTGH